MYTDDKLRERSELKKSTIVDFEIKQFITRHFTKSKSNTYSKEEYLKVFSKVGGALRPTMDPDDLLKELKKDFEYDSRDKVEKKEVAEGEEDKKQERQEPEQPIQYDYLDADKLYDALFELAD